MSHHTKSKKCDKNALIMSISNAVPLTEVALWAAGPSTVLLRKTISSLHGSWRISWEHRISWLYFNVILQPLILWLLLANVSPVCFLSFVFVLDVNRIAVDTHQRWEVVWYDEKSVRQLGSFPILPKLLSVRLDIKILDLTCVSLYFLFYKLR
jgi:hypothetical protein